MVFEFASSSAACSQCCLLGSLADLHSASAMLTASWIPEPVAAVLLTAAAIFFFVSHSKQRLHEDMIRRIYGPGGKKNSPGASGEN